MPDWVAARGLLAYAAGAIEVAAAAALLLRRTSALAAFVGVEGAWLSVGERAELFAGLWILAITLARAQNRARLARFTDDQASGDFRRFQPSSSRR